MLRIAKALVAVGTLAAVLSASSVSADEPSPRHDQRAPKFLIHPDGIEWRTYAAVEAAVAEARRKGVQPEACKISAFEDAENLVVGFSNAQPSTGMFAGCPPGPCMCFQVHLERTSLRVKDSGHSQ